MLFVVVLEATRINVRAKVSMAFMNNAFIAAALASTAIMSVSLPATTVHAAPTTASNAAALNLLNQYNTSRNATHEASPPRSAEDEAILQHAYATRQIERSSEDSLGNIMGGLAITAVAGYGLYTLRRKITREP